MDKAKQDEQIVKHREEYENFSDDDLLQTLHTWPTWNPMHIAAKQELESRNKGFAVKQYETEKSTNLLTKVILAFTVILLIVAGVQLAQSFGAFGTDSIVSVNPPAAIEDTNTANESNNAK